MKLHVLLVTNILTNVFVYLKKLDLCSKFKDNETSIKKSHLKDAIDASYKYQGKYYLRTLHVEPSKFLLHKQYGFSFMCSSKVTWHLPFLLHVLLHLSTRKRKDIKSKKKSDLLPYHFQLNYGLIKILSNYCRKRKLSSDLQLRCSCKETLAAKTYLILFENLDM